MTTEQIKQAMIDIMESMKRKAMFSFESVMGKFVPEKLIEQVLVAHIYVSEKPPEIAKLSAVTSKNSPRINDKAERRFREL